MAGTPYCDVPEVVAKAIVDCHFKGFCFSNVLCVWKLGNRLHTVAAIRLDDGIGLPCISQPV